VTESTDYRYVFGSFNFNNAEAGQALTLAGAPVPPEGQVGLSLVTGRWSAQLRKDGLYVEIDGGSRAAVLEAARSLRQLPKY
jgi:hypothetical protein